MPTTTIASAAAVTKITAEPARLWGVIVTTAGTGTGNVTFSDGYKYTDLAIDASNTLKVTSASHNFVASDVGLALQITAGSGFTTGTYNIVSVASNAAFLDRSAGTAGSTSGSYNVGTGNVVWQIPATVSVNTPYALPASGMPCPTGIYVTNVASGPVLTVAWSPTTTVS